MSFAFCMMATKQQLFGLGFVARDFCEWGVQNANEKDVLPRSKQLSWEKVDMNSTTMMMMVMRCWLVSTRCIYGYDVLMRRSFFS